MCVKDVAGIVKLIQKREQTLRFSAKKIKPADLNQHGDRDVTLMNILRNETVNRRSIYYATY